MTVLYWRIAFLVSIVLLIAVIVIGIVTKLLKNKYYHRFNNDELIKTTKTANSTNSIYFTSGITQKYIKKYVLCKTVYDKYLVCNFVKPYNKIQYFVIQYNRRKQVVGVLRVEETNTRESSKVIALKSNCKYVNVVVGTVDGMVINEEVIRPLSIKRIRLHALLRCLRIYLILFIIRHLIIEIGTVAISIDYLFIKFNLIEQMKIYLQHPLNYVAVFAPALLLFISYFITVKCFRRRNVKSLQGGALEYEFI